MASLDRRRFLELAAVVGASGTVFPAALLRAKEQSGEITVEVIRQAEEIAGLSFSDEQREMMIRTLTSRRDDYIELRALELPNHVLPSIAFDPGIGGTQAPRLDAKRPLSWRPETATSRPDSDEDLAFMTVSELASLMRSRQVTSVELTRLYLSRLRRYDPVLEAVVTYTEERAMRQARAADAELDAGHWRGPLHGIPWGAKDLLSVSGYPTTWGAAPYRDQVIDADAEVVRRLDAAGAVLVAKLTLGALAMGDVWFGGRTNNPWNIEQGSSGSSAGPGAAVAAGCVGFAVGSETLGSIVSPSTRNGVTGFRPTFGRVSRSGAMTLSWTMDKLGPMCRSAEDCALVFDTIHGRDPADPVSVTTAFSWPSPQPMNTLRVGYLEQAFQNDYGNQEADLRALAVFRDAGVEMVPVALPDMEPGPMLLMLSAEASAAFDSLMLSGKTDELTRQDRGAWPNNFRASRFIPAVEYINASRARTLLMQEMDRIFRTVDVIVTPTFSGDGLRITNLTGHPSVTLPNLFEQIEEDPSGIRRQPESFTIIGGLYQDDLVLEAARMYQSQTGFHRMRPPIR